MSNILQTDFIFNNRDENKIDSLYKKISDLDKKYGEIGKSNNLAPAFENTAQRITSTITKFTSGQDALMKNALADIERMKRQNILAEKEITKQVEREAKLQADYKIREGKRAANEALKILKETQSKASGRQGIASDVLGGLGVPLSIGAAIGLGVAGIKSATEAAFDAERANRQLSASATQAGLSYQFLAQKSKEFAEEGGLSQTAANRTEGLIAKLAQASGRPKDLDLLETRLLDTASARGIQVQQLETIVNAIISGSSDEPLNAIGLSDPGKLAKDYADSVGKSVDALTKQEQVLSRLNPFLQQAETLTGANADRMKSLSGQAETASARLEDLQTKFGKGVTSSLEFRDALSFANDILKEISVSTDEVQKKLAQGFTPRQVAEVEANKTGSQVLDNFKNFSARQLATIAYPIDAVTNGFNTANERFLGSVEGAKKRRIEALTDLIESEQKLLEKQNKAAEKQKTFLSLQTFEDQEKSRLEGEKKALEERRKEFDKKYSNLSGLNNITQNRQLISYLNQNQDLFTTEEFAKRIHDVQKAITDEIKTANEKVKELGKNYNSVIDDTYSKLARNNPIAKSFQEGEQAVRKLNEELAKTPDQLKFIVRNALDVQKQLNAENLFSSRVDNALSVFDLKETAAKFRNAGQAESSSKFFEDAVKNDISRGNFFPNLGGTYGSFIANQAGGFDKLTDAQKRDIYEVNQLKNLQYENTPINRLNNSSLITRLANERVNGFGEDLSASQRLQKQFDIINSFVSTDADRALADKKILGLAGNIDPTKIGQSDRERIAAAAEREAERQSRFEEKSFQLREREVKAQERLIEVQENLIKAIQEKGADAVNDLVKIEISESGFRTTGSAGTQEDVRNTYFNEAN